MKTFESIPEGAKSYVKKPIPIQAIQIFEHFEVVTLEGTMKGKPGDWLMKGIRGELYPCDMDIFRESYEDTAMPVIKFSHRYLKIPRDFQMSKILAVLPVKLEDLPEAFLAYDTAYEEDGEIKYYKLPKSGNFMIILLLAGSGKGQLWTTIRSQWPPSKLKYYQDMIGQVVECQVTE